MRRWLARFGVLAAALVPSGARADSSQRAEALFDRGLQHMLAGRYAEACPLIADSQRIEPLPGTLFTLAECNAKAGRIATAVSLYSEYIAFYSTLSPQEQALQGARLQVSIDERASLVKDIPRLTLQLPPTAPDGTVVTRDGAVLDASLLGRPLSVDPGESVVVTRAPGAKPTEHRITMRRGEQRVVELQVSTDERRPLAAPDPEADEPEAEPVASRESAPGGARASSSEPWVWVAGGVGVTGVVVGSVTGILVFSRSAEVDRHCRGTRCDREGLEAAEDGRRLATVSNVSFGVGVLGLGVAAFLALDGSGRPSKGSMTPYVAAHGAGVTGAW